MPFRFLEHTADLRAECRGADFAGLLCAAAEALTSVAFTALREETGRVCGVALDAETAEEMVVRWLQELIFLVEAEKFAPVRFVFECASPESVRGRIEGYAYSEDERSDEVKAATYHGMRVERGAEGWRAEVVFDL